MSKSISASAAKQIQIHANRFTPAEGGQNDEEGKALYKPLGLLLIRRICGDSSCSSRPEYYFIRQRLAIGRRSTSSRNLAWSKIDRMHHLPVPPPC